MAVCDDIVHDTGRRVRPGATRIGGMALAFAAALAAAQPATAARIDGINLRYGEVLDPSGIGGWSVGVDIKPESPPRFLTWVSDDVNYQISVGRWRDTGRSNDEDIESIEGTVFWRFRPEWLADRWFLKWGAGFAWLDQDQLDDDRNVGGPPLFATDLTFAREIGPSRRWHLGLRFRHNSNGGFLGDDGQGVNILGIELGYRFGGP